MAGDDDDGESEYMMVVIMMEWVLNWLGGHRYRVHEKGNIQRNKYAGEPHFLKRVSVSPHHEYTQSSSFPKELKHHRTAATSLELEAAWQTLALWPIPQTTGTPLNISEI